MALAERRRARAEWRRLILAPRQALRWTWWRVNSTWGGSPCALASISTSCALLFDLKPLPAGSAIRQSLLHWRSSATSCAKNHHPYEPPPVLLGLRSTVPQVFVRPTCAGRQGKGQRKKQWPGDPTKPRHLDLLCSAAPWSASGPYAQPTSSIPRSASDSWCHSNSSTISDECCAAEARPSRAYRGHRLMANTSVIARLRGRGCLDGKAARQSEVRRREVIPWSTDAGMDQLGQTQPS